MKTAIDYISGAGLTLALIFIMSVSETTTIWSHIFITIICLFFIVTFFLLQTFFGSDWFNLKGGNNKK